MRFLPPPPTKILGWQKLLCTELEKTTKERDLEGHKPTPVTRRVWWKRTLRAWLEGGQGEQGWTLSKMGLWGDGCEAPLGDTTAPGREVVGVDNAHGDNQRALEDKALDITGWAQGQLTGDSVCSKPPPYPRPLSVPNKYIRHTPRLGWTRGVPVRLQGVPEKAVRPQSPSIALPWYQEDNGLPHSDFLS